MIHVASGEKHGLVEDHELQMVRKVYSNPAISRNISSGEWSPKWCLHEDAQLKAAEWVWRYLKPQLPQLSHPSSMHTTITKSNEYL